MKKNKSYERFLLCSIINIFLSIVKWLCLIACVMMAGLAIGLLVMQFINADGLANSVLAKMGSLMSFGKYSNADIINLIATKSKADVIIALVGFNFAVGLNYALLYILVSRLKRLLTSFIEGNMYTLENVELINSSLPITVLCAFEAPVIIYVITEMTGIFTISNINMSGITYIFVCYVLKFLVEEGYESNQKNIKFNKKITDLKVRETELVEKEKEAKKELRKVKREAKKEETPKKKTTTKKTTKK